LYPYYPVNGNSHKKGLLQQPDRSTPFFISNRACTSSDSMDPNRKFFSQDAYAKQAGIELLDVSVGRAKVKMEICDRHTNGHGTVHGGAIFTLADTAFALASNSHGIPAAAINAHISYMKSVTSGTLFAEAEEFTKNAKLGSYIVRVTDGNGERVAIFQGMVYRKTPRV